MQDATLQLVDEREAARILGVTPRCLQARRYRGEPPSHVKLGSRTVRYSLADLRDYIDAQRRTSTSDPGPAAA